MLFDNCNTVKSINEINKDRSFPYEININGQGHRSSVNMDQMSRKLLSEAEEMNTLLKFYDVRENIPIKSELPFYIPSSNIDQGKLNKTGIRYEVKGENHIFYLNYILDSGCDVPVLRDTFCEILRSYEKESRIISVPA